MQMSTEWRNSFECECASFHIIMSYHNITPTQSVMHENNNSPCPFSSITVDSVVEKLVIRITSICSRKFIFLYFPFPRTLP